MVLAIPGVAFSVAPYYAVVDIVRTLTAREKDVKFYLLRAGLIALLGLGRVLCHAFSTANVDPENENELMSAIQALTNEKAVIMIAHRLKTVEHADQILVGGSRQDRSAGHPCPADGAGVDLQELCGAAAKGGKPEDESGSGCFIKLS